MLNFNRLDLSILDDIQFRGLVIYQIKLKFSRIEYRKENN
jgi:hypothetical protein